MLSALGVESSRLPIELYDNGVRHVYVMLPSFADVAAVRPDSQALEAAAGEAGVNVFAVEDGRVKTRMFMLDVGIAEDPATGSAAGPLAVHLARWGVIPWGEEIDDLAGRRDRSSEHAVRPSTQRGWRGVGGRGGWLGGRGGARRVQAVAERDEGVRFT